MGKVDPSIRKEQISLAIGQLHFKANSSCRSFCSITSSKPNYSRKGILQSYRISHKRRKRKPWLSQFQACDEELIGMECASLFASQLDCRRQRPPSFKDKGWATYAEIFLRSLFSELIWEQVAYAKPQKRNRAKGYEDREVRSGLVPLDLKEDKFLGFRK